MKKGRIFPPRFLFFSKICDIIPIHFVIIVKGLSTTQGAGGYPDPAALKPQKQEVR